MTATIKSRVLVREEKGFGGVSMKRLIGCGMVAGLSYLLINLSPLSSLSLPILLIAFVLAIVMTGQRYGVARYRWLLLGLEARLLLNAQRHPSGWLAQLCEVLQRDDHQLTVRSTELFRTIQNGDDADFAGIAILDSDALDAGSIQLVEDS